MSEFDPNLKQIPVDGNENECKCSKKNKITKDQIIHHSFFTPSCGAGSLPIELAEKAMKFVNELSEKLKKKYGVI